MRYVTKNARPGPAPGQAGKPRRCAPTCPTG